MSVVAEIKDIGPCRKELSIEVPEAAVEAELQRVVQSFRSQAKVPGFRRGKVPVSMVRQRYREDIEKELLDRLIPRYWNQARAELSLEPLLAPEVKEVDFEPDSRLRFVATVEVRPQIELGDLDDFKLPDPDVEVEEAEVEEAIQRLRRDAGTWVEVERAADEGDMVEAYVAPEGHVHNDGEEEAHSHDVAFEVGDQRVWSELSDAVRGRSAGDSGTFERQSGDGEGEGPAKRFEVRISAVKEREPAELDDELAAKLGDFGSVDELRHQVVASITSGKRSERAQQRERALLDQLRERHHFPLPEGVVEMEIEGMLREYANELAARGVDVENAGMDWQAMADQVRPQAVQRVEARLLLDAIGDARQVVVQSEELEATLAALARAQGTSTVAIRQSMAQTERLELLRLQLRRRKTLRELLGDEPPAEADELAAEADELAAGGLPESDPSTEDARE